MNRLGNRAVRWSRGALALAMGASALVGLAAVAPPATAMADPVPGEACTSADLGKRVPRVQNAVVEPTVTHFKTFFITSGATGKQIVQLENSTVITVEVGTTTQITATFNLGVLGNVQPMVNRTVKTITASTDKEVTTVEFNFNNPGYYGVFKGTRKVTGTYSGLNCTRVDKGGGQFATEWVERPGGTYTTYTSMEEGVIRCEDVVPAGTLLKKAQDMIGCEGAAARDARARAREEAAKAQQQPDEEAVGETLQAFAAPPGFTCEAGAYRIGTPDGLLNWWNQDGTNALSLRARSSSTRAQWTLCQGPQTAGMPEHVLITNYSGKCLTLYPEEASDEGGLFYEADCRTVDDRQRFFIYRDLPGSNRVGIQVKSGGFMVGQDRMADGEYMRQYSVGKPDGTGTYVLEKV